MQSRSASCHLLEAVDESAKRRGLTRNAYVRRALEAATDGTLELQSCESSWVILVRVGVLRRVPLTGIVGALIVSGAVRLLADVRVIEAIGGVVYGVAWLWLWLWLGVDYDAHRRWPRAAAAFATAFLLVLLVGGEDPSEIVAVLVYVPVGAAWLASLVLLLACLFTRRRRRLSV